MDTGDGDPVGSDEGAAADDGGERNGRAHRWTGWFRRRRRTSRRLADSEELRRLSSAQDSIQQRQPSDQMGTIPIRR